MEVADYRPTHVRVYVSLWLAALAAIAYVCRTSIAIAEKDIRAALELSEEEMGLVMGPAFFWTYALAQIPTAWLGERYGSRLMIVIFAAASSLATLQFGLADSLWMLLVARMAMGIGHQEQPSETAIESATGPQTYNRREATRAPPPRCHA